MGRTRAPAANRASCILDGNWLRRAGQSHSQLVGPAGAPRAPGSTAPSSSPGGKCPSPTPGLSCPRGNRRLRRQPGAEPTRGHLSRPPDSLAARPEQQPRGAAPLQPPSSPALPDPPNHESLPILGRPLPPPSHHLATAQNLEVPLVCR